MSGKSGKIQLIWDWECAGTAQAPSGVSLRVGPDGEWTPEDLLLAAAEAGVMSIFLALAAKEAVEILGYVSSATRENCDAGLALVVRPCIVLARGADEARVRQLLGRSLELSPVARALRAALRIEPEIVSVESSAALV